MRHLLAWIDKRGKPHVHPKVKGEARVRIMRHMKTYIRERKKNGLPRKKAIEEALKSEHKGLSKVQVQKYEGHVGALARQIRRGH